MRTPILIVCIALLAWPQDIVQIIRKRSSVSLAPSPVSGYTLWLNASDADYLFESSGPPCATSPADGDSIQCWDDEGDGADIAAITPVGGVEPTYESTGIGGLGSVVFDGSHDILRLYSDNASVQKTGADIISASAFTIHAVIRVTADCSDSSPSDDGIIADNNEYWSLQCRTTGGQTKIGLYNYDGSIDVVYVNISQFTDYIVETRHESGTIYLDVYDLSGSLVGSQQTASGNTGSLGGAVNLGRSGGLYWAGWIGEMLVYNTALPSGDRSTNRFYLAGKW